jgi:hypothetical protein
MPFSVEIPALFTKMSILPNLAITSSVTFFQLSSEDTSSTVPWTLSSSFTAATAFSLISAAMTCAPYFVNRSTISLPIPDAPPVMMATLSVNLPIMITPNQLL